MKAFMVMAEAATAHPEGTFSLLRGGINRLNVPKNQNAVIQGALVARVDAGLSESGEHDFQIRCLNEDGAVIGLDLKGKFSFPKPGGSNNFIVNVSMILPRLGVYTFALNVDGHEMATWRMEVVEAPAPGQKG